MIDYKLQDALESITPETYLANKDGFDNLADRVRADIWALSDLANSRQAEWRLRPEAEPATAKYIITRMQHHILNTIENHRQMLQSICDRIYTIRDSEVDE